MNDARLRRYAPLLALAVGLVLLLPALSSVGFWEPGEVRVADAARTLNESGGIKLGLEAQLGKPPAPVWLAALGFKLFGVGELAGRLPAALTTLAALGALFWAAAGFLSRRGALLAALVFASAPGVLLSGRQLSTQAPLLLATTLAFGGLARLFAPREGTSAGARALDALLAAVGLVLALPAGGLLVGVAPPLVGLGLALPLVASAPRATRAVAALLAAAVVAAVVALLLTAKPATYVPWLGGLPHPLAHTFVYTQHLVKMGVQLFPFIGLVPLAAAAALDPLTGEGERSRSSVGLLLALGWLVATWVAAVAQAAAVQDLGIAATPAAALLVGGWLDELLEAPAARPFAAVAGAVFVLVVGRDIFTQPEIFIGAHLAEPVRWPGGAQWVPLAIFGWAGFAAGLVGLGLGAPLGGEYRREAQARGRATVVMALVGGALVAATGVVYAVVPAVSRQLSSRDLYGKTARLDPKAPLGQYRFNATGSSYYASGRTPITLNSSQELFDFLAKPERVFVLAGADELPAIDQTSRARNVPYVIVDDANVRYLVVSNRLDPGQNDLNPIKRFVSTTAPKPQFPVEADFEGKVKLLGYDLAPVLERGADFRIRLHFQVLQPLGGNWKVFLHFDGATGRFHGDHVPLEGRFPTQFWTPGTYVTDEHLIQPDRAQQNPGGYRVFMGLFSGETRMKVTTGPQDGENRVRLGAVTVK